jgi:hypothetical protein
MLSSLVDQKRLLKLNKIDYINISNFKCFLVYIFKMNDDK